MKYNLEFLHQRKYSAKIKSLQILPSCPPCMYAMYLIRSKRNHFDYQNKIFKLIPNQFTDPNTQRNPIQRYSLYLFVLFDIDKIRIGRHIIISWQFLHNEAILIPHGVRVQNLKHTEHMREAHCSFDTNLINITLQ